MAADIPPRDRESLERSWIEKDVQVDPTMPELKRFAGQVGRVKAVNRNGRALVEFRGTADQGWYDIDPRFLTAVDGLQPMARPERPAHLQSWPEDHDRSWWQRLRDWLWGYDFFVSYHWASGGVYAVNLAQILRSKGFDVFLDRADYASGDDWKRMGQIALRNTQRLVLVATRDAVTISKPVQHEVEIFTSRGRQVVPIIFGDRFTDIDRSDYPTLTRLPDSHLFVDSGADSLATGPTRETVEELIRTHKVLRKRNLRALSTLIPAIIVTLFAAFATYQWGDALVAKQSAVVALQDEKKAKENEIKQKKQAVHNLALARVETADSARTRGDYADTAYYYWHARDGLPVSNPLKGSIDGLLASWMPRAGRPFLYEWQQKSRVMGDPDLFPMDDRFQSRLFPVALAPDASLILTVSQDRTVRIWSSITGELRGETGIHESPIRDIAMSSSGGAFAVHCYDNTICTWDTSSLKQIGKLKHDEGPIVDFALTSDGKYVFLGCLNNYARLWDVSTNQPFTPKLEHNLSVRSVAISTDDAVLNSSGAGLKAWEMTGQPKWQSEGFMEMVSAGFDSKSLLVAGGSSPNQAVKQLDIRTGDEINPRHVDLRISDEVLNGEFSCLAVSRDGSRIACGGFDRGTNRGFAMLWDAVTGEPIGAPLPHPFTVRRIALSADGTVLFTTTVGGEVRSWDVTVGTPISQSDRIEGQSSPALLSSCGKYFLIRTGEQTARLFDSLSGRSLGVEAKVAGKCQVLACAPDGKTALLGNWGNTAQLWDLSKGEPVGKRLWESSGVISAAAFSKRGSIVATCNDSGTHIDVWDSKTGERRGGALLGSGGAKSLAIDEKSYIALAGCLNGEVSFVNYETGHEIVSTTKHVGAVNAVALSGDAGRAISGGQDQTARIWDSNGTQVGDALVHDSEVLSVALSEDGSLALTGTGNGKAWLWDVPTGKLRGEVFRHWERPSSEASIEAVAFVNDARVITAEKYGVVRQWAIRGLESSDADALRDRVALLTGWTSGGDGLRQRLTLDQWRKLVAEQDARSKADRAGGR